MRSRLRLGPIILLVVPLLAACAAETTDPAASPTAEATPPDVASPSPTDVASPSPEVEPTCTDVAPDASTIEDLQVVVNNANTEPTLGWLAPTVNVVLAASSANGPQTPDQAGMDLSDFLNTDSSSLPAHYDVALPEAALDAFRAGDYAEHFPVTALVCRGTDNRVVAFPFDCDGLIDT